uniref:Uncharacterized protein n=1 Tax=Pseudo-nitzschia australis TaxID=44445 RepID=A0A7S4EIA7_9STRA|mmetsp:Transcript_131/g.374  ORF Transcript_131/g.374 Transcript_131/m.374 type:complete len:287 (+) Transcript_131:212-1072(+)|eukprot:CAMPEP_0168250186 /NCGR_PEP_ID=MMETSP0141_2-20121125/2414_1 /TAXON_ID=44445 /ORGANISM="Pseudo-nitzschia australis, Strain 10249 10 AB" /LENGTH=286 /DNA_ID=CAMNT_0008186257 /DNA_START=129 /DNA_END=989 /DNA_ORIENTATION=-
MQQRVLIPFIFQILLLLVLSGMVVRSEEMGPAEFLRVRTHRRNDDNSGDGNNDINFDVNPTQEGVNLEEIFRDNVNGGIEDEVLVDNELKDKERKEKIRSPFYKKKTGKRSKNSKKEVVKSDFVYGLDGKLEPVLTKADLERHIKENSFGKKQADALRRAGPLPEGLFDEKRSGSDGRGGVVLTEVQLEDVIKMNKIDDRAVELFRALRPYSYYYGRSNNYYSGKGGKSSRTGGYHRTSNYWYYGGYGSSAFSPYSYGYSYGHQQMSPYYTYYGTNYYGYGSYYSY